jgi:protocatechuate 3,4-dioxygenase beta subunit
MAIQPHGTYHFETVMPGNEVLVGWGEDPAPHIHYDVVCRDCVDNDAFTGGKYQWWSKIYLEDLCTEQACGQPGAVHQVHEKLDKNGQRIFVYDFVLPSIRI